MQSDDKYLADDFLKSCAIHQRLEKEWKPRKNETVKNFKRPLQN